jgi:hypothetical protein
VAHLPELGDVKTKIKYIYLNPVEAGLVDSIDDYAGFNTWQAFLTCEPSVDACIEVRVRYYYKRALKRLPANNVLDPIADAEFLAHLKEQKVQTGRINIVSEEVLKIQPFAFLKRFGITDAAEIEKIRQEIVTSIRQREAELRAERAKAQQPVVGPKQLQLTKVMREHHPKERRPRVSIICANDEVRHELEDIETSILKRCSELRVQAIAGEQVEWPAGVFIPWLPSKETPIRGARASRLESATATGTATGVGVTAEVAAPADATPVAEVVPVKRE